jgi:hypothetical protein
VRLWLSLIAYNLGNLWRQLVLPAQIDRWSLTSGEPPDAPGLWEHAAKDRDAAVANGIGGT